MLGYRLAMSLFFFFSLLRHPLKAWHLKNQVFCFFLVLSQSEFDIIGADTHQNPRPKEICKNKLKIPFEIFFF